MTRSWRLRMADPRGFLRYERAGPRRRPVESRVRDWREGYLPFGREGLTEQASRGMSCGIAFCHEGCPLGNLIPEWNDLVERGRFAEASDRLHATNNFPEFTGRLCGAQCEGSCWLGITSEQVLIKQVELETAEWAASSGVLAPHRVGTRTGKKVAVVGSGPAGLAGAQQLARAGHVVVVFERAERVGGLLRYGIPAFKLEKSVLDRRLAQMEEEGTEFRPRVAVGRPDPSSAPEVPGAAAPDVSVLSATALRGEFDAVVLAGAATPPRRLDRCHVRTGRRCGHRRHTCCGRQKRLATTESETVFRIRLGHLDSSLGSRPIHCNRARPLTQGCTVSSPQPSVAVATGETSRR